MEDDVWTHMWGCEQLKKTRSDRQGWGAANLGVAANLFRPPVSLGSSWSIEYLNRLFKPVFFVVQTCSGTCLFHILAGWTPLLWYFPGSSNAPFCLGVSCFFPDNLFVGSNNPNFGESQLVYLVLCVFVVQTIYIHLFKRPILPSSWSIKPIVVYSILACFVDSSTSSITCKKHQCRRTSDLFFGILWQFLYSQYIYWKSPWQVNRRTNWGHDFQSNLVPEGS